MNSAFRLLAMLCLSLPTVAFGQIELPRVGGGAGMGAIRVLDTSFNSGGRSVSVSVNNGVKTIKAREGDEKVTIVEDPDNGLTVEWTRRYGPKDADELEKSMPGLYMHLKSMPKSVDGATVDVHIDVTRKYEADDKADLENKHPEVFKLYEKYTKNQGLINGRFRIDGGVIRMPEVMDLRDLKLEMKGIEEVEKAHKEMRDKMMERMRELKTPILELHDRRKAESDKDKKDIEKKKTERNDG